MCSCGILKAIKTAPEPLVRLQISNSSKQRSICDTAFPLILRLLRASFEMETSNSSGQTLATVKVGLQAAGQGCIWGCKIPRSLVEPLALASHVSEQSSCPASLLFSIRSLMHHPQFRWDQSCTAELDFALASNGPWVCLTNA